MKKYLFIVVEDLIYVVKNSDGSYTLPEESFNIPFDTTFVRSNVIESQGGNYQFDVYHANIPFPGITNNWKRRKVLGVRKNISKPLQESLYYFTPNVRSAVFPMIDDKHIVLVKPYYLDYYEIPGGAIEYLGSPEQTAINEALEEAGVNVVLQEYVRCRSYVMEVLSPTKRINPQWFVSIEYLGKVVGGTITSHNEIEKTTVENIDNVINGLSRIKVKDNLITGLKLIKNMSDNNNL